MRALLLTFSFLCLLSLMGSQDAFCDYDVADAGPTISGGEGDAVTPREIPTDQCRTLYNGTPSRPEPSMGGGDLRSTDAGLSETCPGAQSL